MTVSSVDSSFYRRRSLDRQGSTNMNVSFYCDNCSKQLTADEIAVGRVIKCPYCRQTTRVTPSPTSPLTEEARAERGEESTSQLLNVEGNAAPQDLSTKLVPSDEIDRDVSDFTLSGAVKIDSLNEETYQAMIGICPMFQPNPFAISYPLDQTVSPDALDDEEDEVAPSAGTSSFYDVDELIKGVE